MTGPPHVATAQSKRRNPHFGPSATRAYGCAVLSAALAVASRALLTPFLGAQFPFFTVYFAVIVTAWYGGLYPTLAAMLLGFLGVVYFAMPPLHTFALRSVSDITGASIFLVLGLTIGAFSEDRRKALARAEASAAEARRQEAAARASEAQRENTENWQRLLAEASDLLASSLDYETTLQRVAQLAVPRFADWCAVDMLDADGSIHRVAVCHSDPTKVELAHELDRRYPPDARYASGAPQVIRTGQSEIVTEIPDSVLRATTQDDRHYEIVKALGLKSYICTPLSARGRNVGAMTFIGAESGLRYGPEDLAQAMELARRAAMAMDNALLFQAERERSEQLTLAIQEVHHRVKNNLQAVSALLEMQLIEETELIPAEAISESLGQIKTIALVHDLLTRDQPIGDVDATQVLTQLTMLLAASLGAPEAPFPIHLDAMPLRLPVKAATSLALAVNELVSNASKHATSAAGEPAKGGRPAVRIRVYRRDEYVIVSVRDNGPGFPPGFDPALHAHVGLELVQSLVTIDLRGSIRFGNGPSQDHCGGETDPGGANVEVQFSPADLSE